MSYTPWINPELDPMTHVDFLKMPARAAEAFARRWINSIPDRIEALEAFVRSTSGYQDWHADYSRESLVRLGSWALAVLRFCPMDPADVERQLAAEKGLSRRQKVSRREILLSEWVYKDRALGSSVAFDISTYLGECLRRECPALYWGRYKDEQVDSYNSPCLFVPNGNPYFTPVHQGRWCLEPILKRTRAPDLIAVKFDEIKQELYIHKYIGNHPPPVQVTKRKGKVVTTACPKCGFGFARVIVREGVYCNHCGHMQAVEAPST